jgi:hemerythrin-like domain-containing protein
MTATATAAATNTTEYNASAQRHDIYAPIHRALRLFMTDTLGRLGWLDCGDAVETRATLDQLDALLGLCRRHLEHENAHVHTALEARRPGASRRIAGEHVEHMDEILALQAEAAALRAAPTAPMALRVYRHLAVFVAENLHHMQVEETTHNELLWASYSDAEIQAIEQRIVASLGDAERALVLRWMTPALPPAERAAWFAGMRQQMPPQAFAMVLDAARAALNDTAWGKLARALGVPPVPGLVEA